MTQKSAARIAFWLWFAGLVSDAILAANGAFKHPPVQSAGIAVAQGLMALWMLRWGWPTEADGPRT